MLQVFRKHAYSVGTRIFLVLLIGVFTIFFGGLGSYMLRVKPVAQVDCHTYFHLFTIPGCTDILPQQVDQEVAGLRRTIQNAYGENAPQMMRSLNLRQVAVEQLVEQAIINRQAHRLGLRISDEDLAREIESQSAFQSDGRFDVERYNEILRNNDIEPANFESDTRRRMLTDLMREMISNTAQVSPDEARREFNRFGEKLSLAYIEFPWQTFTAGVNPDARQVAKFYNENKDMFRLPDQIKLVFIRYDAAALASSQTFSGAEIESYYESHLKDTFTHPEQVRARHILIEAPAGATPQQDAAAKTKAGEILQQLKGGADFAKLAKQYSSDPGTKDNGGELPFFKPGEMVKPFEEEAFKLKPGEFGIAQTQFGFHVIQVEQVKPAHEDTIEEAKPKIIAALRQKAGADVAKQDIEQDIAAAGEGRSLQDLAQKRGLVAVETPYLAENQPIKGAEDNPKLAQEAFKMSVGDLRTVDSGSAPYLVKVLDRKPAHVPPFNDIQAQVRQTLVRITAESKAHDAASAVLKRIKSSGDFDGVAAAGHFDVHQTGEFARAGRQVPGAGALPEVISAAAALPKLPGVLDQVAENDGNSFIFNVISRTPPSDQEWNSAKTGFTEQFLRQKQAAAWIDFVKALRAKSYILVNTSELGESETS
jgi:peptidyl-prolyl cis-trans isomerase D